MNEDNQNMISKLIKHLENHDPALSLKENVIKDYSELSDNLLINNPLHVLLSKSLNLNPVKDIIQTNSLNPNNPNKKRFKYKSQINPEDLDRILNMSIFKNIPQTANMFGVYESKKNLLIRNQEENKNGFKPPSKLNNVSSGNSYSGNNFQNNYNKKQQVEDDDDDNVVQHNTYMNNSYYLKRKK